MAYPSKPQRNKEIVKKRNEGWSLREIGNFYNLHHSTVDEVVRRWSISRDKTKSGVVDKDS